MRDVSGALAGLIDPSAYSTIARTGAMVKEYR
jgi:hypothetical protein